MTQQKNLILITISLFQVLCLIGEAFDSFDDICGAVVNIRAKGDKIGKFRSLPTHSII